MSEPVSTDADAPSGRRPMSSLQVALLTPPGRAALAVVGIAGPGAVAAVDRSFAARRGPPLATRPDGAIAFGRWRSRPADPGEEVVVVRRRAEVVEVHGHGGLAAPAAILASLIETGAAAVSWQEWMAGAGGAPIEIEARAALAVAGGPRAARILARQLAGTLSSEIERIGGLMAAGDGAAAAAACGRLERAVRVGLRLVRPWRVVLSGPVNAGKSSLANALAGHARSLVSPLPGTTRDVVETRLVIEGWEIDLVDTAGLRDGEAIDPVEQAGIARARGARAEADLVLRVVESTDAALPRLRTAADELIVVTKADLLPAGAALRPDAEATSAVTGAGVATLAARIAAALVPEERAEPDLLAGAVPFTLRQVEEIRRLASPAARA